jgi:hypothetical protein
MVGLGSHGTWTADELQILLGAARTIEIWFARMGGGEAQGRMRAALGGTRFIRHAGVILPDKPHVRGSTVHLIEGDFDVDLVVHEVGHVLDNNLGYGVYPGSALWGGGPADDMSRQLGGTPTRCGLNRSRCRGYDKQPTNGKFPTPYAKNGPSEDFAESLKYSVLNPGSLSLERARFMVQLGRSLTTDVGEFQGSPYASFRREGGAIYSGSGSRTGNGHVLR